MTEAVKECEETIRLDPAYIGVLQVTEAVEELMWWSATKLQKSRGLA